MKCSECQTDIIPISFTNEEGKKDVMYAHGETTKSCTLKNDGIEIKITDQKMNNIYSAMITEQIKEMGEEKTVELNSEASSSNSIGPQQSPRPLNRGEILKRRLCEGLVSVSEFDLILNRLKEDVK